MLAGEEEEDKSANHAAEIFEKMDSNKDNVLSKEEFVRGCLQDECLYQMLMATTEVVI